MGKLLTVFTPTYNRAYCLRKCYESLCRQTSFDFIWLIIDDGSSDGTAELVEQWEKEKKIDIEYYYKPNGGMHTAHNAAYEKIHTELNVCVDSDDYLTDDAVEKIIRFWKENGNDTIGGIYALDRNPDGGIIGQPFPADLKSFQGWGCKYIIGDDRKKYKIIGDKKFISVTKVLQKYPPIPVFDGEKYYSLYYKQYFIERDYRILIMNEAVCVVEYGEDGSSRNIFKQYINNPQGFRHLRILMMRMVPLKRLQFIQAVHYVSSCILLKDRDFLKNSPRKIFTFLAVPFGIALFLYTKYMYNKIIKIKN